jgi:acetolactate synthase-1/2/3 large subunit
MSQDDALLPSGGDVVAEVLARHGVRFLFTLCGGHISPILVGAKRRGIRVVDVRHEATAVFAADAVARLTGVPGAAAVTAGPGLTNAVTAIQNARMAQSPLVVLAGATATLLRGCGALQDIDQMALARPLVKRAFSPRRLARLAPDLEEAFAECRRGVPGPVLVECPVDLLYDPGLVREWYGAKAAGRPRGLADAARRFYIRRHVERLFAGPSRPTAAPAAPPVAAPAASRVSEAAARLRRSERPVLLVGSQALLDVPGVPHLAQAVAALGMPVYLSGTARGLLGPVHPLLMRHRRKEALREADLVVLAGTPCDFRLDYGRHIGARAVIVAANRDGSDLRRNRRPAVAVQAAPDLFLRALASEPPDAGRWVAWRGELRRRDEEREAEIALRSQEATTGVHPLALCREIDRALDDDSVIVADGGDFVSTASYVVRPRRPLSWLDPGVFGTLGVGAGFALGAKLCRPGAEVWILYGDGSVGYSLAEADTFVRHGLPVVAVVGNDAGWTQIAREQVERLGDAVGTELRRTDYHRAAQGLGADGFSVDAAGDVASVLRAAKDAARRGAPVYVNAHIGKTDFRKGSISI